MKIYKHKGTLIIVFCILLGSLIGGNGCANTEGHLAFSDYGEIPEKPPIELSTSQLYEDYITDPIAAHDKYKWKRLCFYKVEVEEVDDRDTKRFFISGNVKFYLRSMSKMQNVEPGFVLNLVGECRGIEYMPREVVTVTDCWAEGVNCDLGEDELFSIGY